MTFGKYGVFFLFAYLLFSIPSYADVYLAYKESLDGLNAALRFHKFYIREDRVRYDVIQENHHVIKIFSIPDKTVKILDASRSIFSEFSIKDLLKIEKKFQLMLADYEKRVNELSGDERAIAKNLRQVFSMSPKALEGISYKRVPGEAKIRRWTGLRYDGLVQGERVRDLLTVPWIFLDVEAADLEPLNQVRETFYKSGIVRQNSRWLLMSANAEKFHGFPAKITEIKGDKVKLTVELLRADKKSFSDDQFAIPKGYRRVEHKQFIPN